MPSGGVHPHHKFPSPCSVLGGLCCKTRSRFADGFRGNFRIVCNFDFYPDSYARQGAGVGGGRQRSLASRLRFCAVAASSTSSLTPVKPLRRSRSILRIRVISANRVSTFLHSLYDRWTARYWPSRGRDRALFHGDHESLCALQPSCTSAARQ
jgi:hypothetical protein